MALAGVLSRPWAVFSRPETSPRSPLRNGAIAPNGPGVSSWRELFPGQSNRQVRQGKIGNCYQITGVLGLKYLDPASLTFQRILSQTVSRARGSQGEPGWQVRFRTNRPVFVSDQDIDTKGQDLVHEGDPGDRLLAVAYGRYRSQNRLTFLGNETRIAAEGGQNGEFVEALTGWQSQKVAYRQGPFSSADLSTRRKTIGILARKAVNAPVRPDGRNNNDRQKYIVYAGCSEWPGMKLYGGRFSDPQKKVFLHHSYLVERVDWQFQTVTLLNPHDSSRPIYKSLDQFLAQFNRIVVTFLPTPIKETAA